MATEHPVRQLRYCPQCGRELRIEDNRAVCDNCKLAFYIGYDSEYGDPVIVVEEVKPDLKPAEPPPEVLLPALARWSSKVKDVMNLWQVKLTELESGMRECFEKHGLERLKCVINKLVKGKPEDRPYTIELV